MNLYSTRNLSTLYVDISCQNPFCVQSGPAELAWHWLVDLTFLAWAFRVCLKAKQSFKLKPTDAANFDFLRAYCQKKFGFACDGVRAAAANPVALAPIPAEWFDPVFRSQVGVAGKGEWQGYQNDFAKWGKS